MQIKTNNELNRKTNFIQRDLNRVKKDTFLRITNLFLMKISGLNGEESFTFCAYLINVQLMVYCLN